MSIKKTQITLQISTRGKWIWGIDCTLLNYGANKEWMLSIVYLQELWKDYYILSHLNFSLMFAQCHISGIFLRWFTQVFSTLILYFRKYFSSDLKKNDFLAIYGIPGSCRYLQHSKWTGILKCSKYFETTFWSGSCLLCRWSINVEHKEKEWARHTFTRRTLTKIWG